MHGFDFATHPWLSSSSQSKAIVLGFPQTQARELLVHSFVDFRPERANNIFAGGRNCAELLCFQIEVPVLPRLNGIRQRFLERDEIVKGAASFVVISADRRFREIQVTVTAGIVAFTK